MILIAWVCLFKFVAFLSFFTKKLFCHNILFAFEYNKWWKWMNWRLKKSALNVEKFLSHSFPPLNWIKTKSILLFAFSLATCNNFLSIFSVFFSFYLSFSLFLFGNISRFVLSLSVCPFIQILSEKNKSSGVRT
jgi:hypothetical protein